MRDARSKLVALRDEWTGCTKCELHKLREDDSIVFGAGPYNAEFMLITEAPTITDIAEGHPITGDVGKLIDALLEEAGIPPKKVFRANIVACRPYLIIPETDEQEEQIKDRLPTKEEIAACLPRLQETIYLVDPRVIVAMGDLAWKVLVKDRGTARTVAQAQGTLFDTWVPGRTRPIRYPVMAALPPKQLLSNPSAAEHGPIASTLECLQKVANYVKWLKEHEEKEQP